MPLWQISSRWQHLEDLSFDQVLQNVFLSVNEMNVLKSSLGSSAFKGFSFFEQFFESVLSSSSCFVLF